MFFPSATRLKSENTLDLLLGTLSIEPQQFAEMFSYREERHVVTRIKCRPPLLFTLTSLISTLFRNAT